MENSKYYQEKLQTMREKVKTEIKTPSSDSALDKQQTSQEIAGELSTYDNHPADTGNITFEQGKELGFQGRAKFVLQMIDDALNQIETGEYGQCDDCGQKIDRERLTAIPYSTMCKECKSVWETIEDKSSSDRPVEEEVLADLPGDEFSMTDGVDNNSYDGEDTWQDLAGVGTSNTPGDVSGAQGMLTSYIDADENESIVSRRDE